MLKLGVSGCLEKDQRGFSHLTPATIFEQARATTFLNIQTS